MNYENKWVRFYSEFSKIHGEFIKSFTFLNPGVSSSQFRVCAYLKAGYNTREMAEEMDLSIRSVESHRYRIRKKLKVKRAESLIMHLHGQY